MATHPEFATGAQPDLVEQRILRAIHQYHEDTGEAYSVVRKAKTLSKFGRSLNIDSTGFKTVWAGQAINDEPPKFGDPTAGNLVDSVTSANTGDDQTLRIEGHTISGSDLTFVAQNVTLTGQTPVTLATPLHHCTRILNTDDNDITGPVYVYDNTDGQSAGVPTDATDVAGYLAAGEQQTQQCFTAISSQDLWIVTQLIVSANRQQTAAYDVVFEKRNTSGVWLPIEVELGLDTTGTSTVQIQLNPCIVVPPNTYIRARARSSSATDGEVSADIGGYLALRVD